MPLQLSDESITHNKEGCWKDEGQGLYIYVPLCLLCESSGVSSWGFAATKIGLAGRSVPFMFRSRTFVHLETSKLCVYRHRIISGTS